MEVAARKRVKEELEEVDEAFEEVVSLGSLCAASAWLQDRGLRAAAYPFDWVHSSPAMVRHCIRDDFATLLDRRQYYKAGRSGRRGAGIAVRGIGHRVYSSMLLGAKKRVVWRHHDPLTKEKDFQLLQRCVERFRRILSNHRKRKLFVILELVRSVRVLRLMHDSDREQDGQCRESEGGGPWMGADSEIRGLFQELCSANVKHFHIDVVRLCIGSASKAKKGRPKYVRHFDSSGICAAGSETLTIHELHCVNGHTGLRFKSKLDEGKLSNLLLGTGATTRKFRVGSITWIKPRQSPNEATGKHGRRGRNYNDDAGDADLDVRASQADNLRNILKLRSRGGLSSKPSSSKGGITLKSGLKSQRGKRSSGSFAVRQWSVRKRLEVLARAMQDDCIIDVSDSDDSPSHGQINQMSVKRELQDDRCATSVPGGASLIEQQPVALFRADAPVASVAMDYVPVFPIKLRRRRLRGKQPLPPDELEDDDPQPIDLDVGSLGHTLQPAELGHRIAVNGDGWGNPGPGFKAIVTEADDFTFTVVVIDGPDSWKEAHVLREHCVRLSGG